MAPEEKEKPEGQESGEVQQYKREELSPAKQKRFQQCFDHGSKQMAQENYDYAVQLFEQCVIGDPKNRLYVESMLANLKKKYGNNRTGSKLAQFKERGARSGVKKAISQEKWEEALKHGVRVLTVNPWDIPALRALATASENMGDDESEMVYLKAALESNPKDPEVNRHCAAALAARKQFDQAIACLHRVELLRPNDEDIRREIATLAVEKTITMQRGGSGDPATRGQAQDPQAAMTLEEGIQQRINRNPKELANYYELAQVHLNNEDYKAAEEVFEKAFDVSGGDEDVREKWEDAELRHLRQQLGKADKGDDEELKDDLLKQLKKKELSVFKKRAERYPNNLLFKYDLGLRYKMNGQFNEAIKEFQKAQNDPRRRGVCMLALGQCFEKINVHGLSLKHYKIAIEDIPDRDAKNKKMALYLTGKICITLKDLDAAEKHLSTLAGLDFAYKDVSDLLAKIAELRAGGGENEKSNDD